MRFAVHGGCYQSPEAGDTMVAVYHIVAYAQLIDFFQRDDGFAAPCIFAGECHAVETLEYLVVGVAAYFQTLVHKSCVQGLVHCHKPDWLAGYILKDGSQAVGLFFLVGKDIQFVPLGYFPAQVIGQQVEILIEYRLGEGVKSNMRIGPEITLFVQFDSRGLRQTLFEHIRQVAVFQFRAAGLPAEFVKQKREIVACPYRVLADVVRNRIVFSLFFP